MRATAALIRRSATGTLRQPAAWLPGLLLPLAVAAVFTADYQQSAQLLGLPGGVSYSAYVLPTTALIGALYAGITAGTAVVEGSGRGLLDRLLLSPTSPAAILAGPLAIAAVQAVLQDLVFVVVFALFGVGLPGPAGTLLLVLATAGFAVAVGALATALGLRTGDSEIMQSLFGLVFILMFFSSAFFPPGLMRGWFRAGAQHSPLTWLVDGIRDRSVLPALLWSVLPGVFAVAWARQVLAGSGARG